MTTNNYISSGCDGNREKHVDEMLKKRNHTVMIGIHPTMSRLRSGSFYEEEIFHDHENFGIGHVDHEKKLLKKSSASSVIKTVLGQIPAVALIVMFHLMISIPFGVSYFPIGWRAHSEGSTKQSSDIDDGGVNGSFPYPGKESLGIRMFLFASISAQIVLTFKSKFTNAIGIQMVENVPFFQALAVIVISNQGYGADSLSTLFFLFGFSSVFVGLVFYFLGKMELGKIVYLFPSHVLLGLIGGIGLFLSRTGIEVTLDTAVTFNKRSFEIIIEHIDLVGAVFAFEVVLRGLQFVTTGSNGKGKYPLLSPIYFCMITPIFYSCLWMFHININDAKDAGYFFPSIDECNDQGGIECPAKKSFMESSFNSDAFLLWRIIDIHSISWTSVIRCIPTIFALAIFSLIHVPINIPAFAVSTNVEADMNAELIAHGYSNAVSGLFGGLQNYMAYTQSVLYARSNGDGKYSSIAVAGASILLFFIGPTIASYIPRCMAGTLLLHVGIDLFLEGVYDTFGEFDDLEYAGICFIAIAMTSYGMEAAMIVGVISALLTYAIQNITHLKPIRGSMSAATLRSSSLSRCPEAVEILNNPRTGRKRIQVIQLQGHLFFGNVAQITDGVHHILRQKKNTDEEPLIVMIDFTLVLGIDSSAAQAIVKLKDVIRKTYQIKVSIFVTGTDNGFPCEFKLSKGLRTNNNNDYIEEDYGSSHLSIIVETESNSIHDTVTEISPLLQSKKFACTDKQNDGTYPEGSLEFIKNTKSYVTSSLDEALGFAEDVLIVFENEDFLSNLDDIDIDAIIGTSLNPLHETTDSNTYIVEGKIALRYLNNLSPGQNMSEIKELFSSFRREEYVLNDIIWKQGAPSDSMKLVLRGSLVSILENEAGTRETIKSGNTIGELGLVHGVDRISTVQCASENAILYSLSLESWESLIVSNPMVARVVDMLLIRYLALRVQHVSNRIYETRCLPI